MSYSASFGLMEPPRVPGLINVFKNRATAKKPSDGRVAHARTAQTRVLERLFGTFVDKRRETHVIGANRARIDGSRYADKACIIVREDGCR